MASRFRAASGNPLIPLRTLAIDIVDAQDRGLRAAGLALLAATKNLLSTPGTGREYKRGRKVHIASAPGAPPAPDTGDLRNSMDMEKVDRLRYRVGTGAEPAPHLEFGTEHIAPRPFMRPAKAAVEKEMNITIVSELKRAKVKP